MSTVTKPLLLNETGQEILEALQGIAAVSGSVVSVSESGTATDEVGYITINGVEKKLAGGGGGGGGEPNAYIKDASANGNTLTLTKKDNSTVVFTPSGEPATYIKEAVLSNNGQTITLTKKDNTTVVFEKSDKQDTLVSGTNIKTINNQSVLGSGNISISGGDSNFVFLTGEETYAEIQDIVEAEKVPVMNAGGCLLTVDTEWPYGIGFGGVFLSNTDEEIATKLVMYVTDDDEWGSDQIEFLFCPTPGSGAQQGDTLQLGADSTPMWATPSGGGGGTSIIASNRASYYDIVELLDEGTNVIIRHYLSDDDTNIYLHCASNWNDMELMFTCVRKYGSSMKSCVFTVDSGDTRNYSEYNLTTS